MDINDVKGFQKPEWQVLKLLTHIKADPQFDPKSDMYCGFLNCSQDFFPEDWMQKAYLEFISKPMYYKCLLNLNDLDTDGIDADETVFILKN